MEKSRFNLMGVDIDNMRAVDAVNKICKSRMGKTQVGYFINVNSINLAWSSRSMMDNLNKSDFNLADGSGVRLGAQRQGVKLLDNNNGTDLLPLLCKKLAKEGKAIYMLGAKPGVALKAAINLQEAYPGLLIAGTRDGYFSDDKNSDVVESINKSLASVVLVAMGSPRQEAWIAENSDKLNVDTVLAVGGLFDFFSGNIPRSPEFLRLIGAEWLFRLYQEPLTKFKRYVVGNPIYLWRLYTS
jgi:N-acetylglucosaminyldiphosphoundecaprenol N-acetyl-beta-D-mannosaminyltransferase